jgi:hypothetical protein
MQHNNLHIDLKNIIDVRVWHDCKKSPLFQGPLIKSSRCTVKNFTKPSRNWEKCMLRREYYQKFGPIQRRDFSGLKGTVA